MATGVAQIFGFAVMHTFSVAVVAVVIVFGAVYVFGPLVPEVGEPCSVMGVVAEVSAPGAALDGDGVSVQVRPLAVPSF
jgi:hypothetical protein